MRCLKWLLALPILLAPASAEALSARDHLAVFTAIVVEAELSASTAITPSPSPSPGKVKRSQCPECKGTGKVKTGDGILTVDCENCEPDSAAACPCGDDCDCSPGGGCGCADRVPLVPVANAIGDALAMAGGCEGGSCNLPAGNRGACTSGSCGRGGSVAVRPGQPVRNVARVGRGLGRRFVGAVNRARPLRRVGRFLFGGCRGCR